VTVALPQTDSVELRLPLWRLIGGLAVLGTLAALLFLASLVYLNDFRLNRYMRSLAEQPGLSDAALSESILTRSKQFGLTVHPYDIEITRTAGKPRIRIAKFTVQTRLVRMDLRLPAADSQ
jgi:hypothetical protein